MYYLARIKRSGNFLDFQLIKKSESLKVCEDAEHEYLKSHPSVHRYDLKITKKRLW